MRYHDINHPIKLYKCDACGRDGLSSVINSKNMDYCLECWDKADNVEVVSVEKEKERTIFNKDFLSLAHILLLRYFPFIRKISMIR